MSESIKQLKLEAEARIEGILEELQNKGVAVFRIQLIQLKGLRPEVNLMIDERGGQ